MTDTDKKYSSTLRMEIAQYLLQLVTYGELITYGELAIQFGLKPKGLGDHRHILIQILKEIQKIDIVANRPPRTVVVISSATFMPGNGYFDLLHIDNDVDRQSIFGHHRSVAMRYYRQILLCDTASYTFAEDGLDPIDEVEMLSYFVERSDSFGAKRLSH